MIVLHRVNDLKEYLGNRRADPRVKYFTFVNHGKKYPYSNERQNTRAKRKRERSA